MQSKRNLAALVLCLVLCGCAAPSWPTRDSLVPGYRPENVFTGTGKLPVSIRRVAVLPMTCDELRADAVSGREALEPILKTELAKANSFELCPISPEALRQRTGQPAWDAGDTLPADFLAWLSEDCGCDAVWFCRLTAFRGYSPLLVGWRIRLVDTHTRLTLWAADEVFDASQAAVRAGARRFQPPESSSIIAASDDWLIDNSPRRFGQYAAAQLVATLPRR